jgi:hypothetical protein
MFFCCFFFFKRHIKNTSLLLRATRLLRFHDTCTDSATIASAAAFSCQIGLNRDYRA